MNKNVKNKQVWLVPDKCNRTHHIHVKVNGEFYTLVCGEYLSFEDVQDFYFWLKGLKNEKTCA